VTDKTWTDHAGNAVRSLSSGIYTDHVFTDDGKEIAAVTLGSSTDGEGKISLTLYNKEGKTTHTISQPVVDGDSITTGKDTIINETAYDVNGNVTTYTYDAENRLSKVSVTDKDGKTAVIQQNRYNGDGQRIQKVEGSKTTNYYYQDGVVSYTTDGENSQTSQNLIGTDGNILATQKYGSDHTDYLLYHVVS
jgi:YD repeat-containing protein